jgi:hypothetical protein
MESRSSISGEGASEVSREASPPERVRGPDFVVVAWIPWASRLSQVPGLAHVTRKDLRRLKLSHAALKELFRSGNQTPTADLTRGQAELDAIRAGKQYRAILKLSNVFLECDAQSATITADLQKWVGFTPIRLGSFDAHSRGKSGPIAAVLSVQSSHGPDGATYSCRYRFKLSFVANVAGAILTRRWAPWAWIQVDYSLSRDGNWTISVSGSFVPSCNYYVDWRRVGGHDMTIVTPHDLANFINGGNCKDAPGRAAARFVPVNDPE